MHATHIEAASTVPCCAAMWHFSSIHLIVLNNPQSFELRTAQSGVAKDQLWWIPSGRQV